MKKQFGKFQYILIMIVAFLLFVFSVSFNLKNLTFGEGEEFTLSTGSYVQGTWSNQDVTILIENFTYQQQDYVFEYQLNGGAWQEFEDGFTLTQEGEFDVVVRFDNSVVTYTQTAQIKIDKTAPTNITIFLSTEDYTDENVFLTIVGTDGLSGVGNGNSYRLKEGEWQSSNIFEIGQNTVFDIGDIQVRDWAGNVGFYSSVLTIDNIDKEVPAFTLVADTVTTKESERVVFDYAPVVSGIKSVTVQKVGSNEITDITSSYEDGYVVTSNGEYIFTFTSNLDKTFSVGIIFNNINQNFKVSFYIVFLSLAGVIIFLNIYETIKYIINVKYQKKLILINNLNKLKLKRQNNKIKIVVKKTKNKNIKKQKK